MTPIFFPYTYMSESSAMRIHAVLGAVDVIQPSSSGVSLKAQSLSDKDLIKTVFPVTENDKILIQSVRAFEEWGKFHQKKNLSFFKSIIDEIPNYDELSTSRIRSEIGQMLQKPTLPEKEKKVQKLTRESFVWWARVFLQLAQEFDESKDEMDDVLSRVDRMTESLFKDLKGEVGEDMMPAEKGDTTDFKKYNVSERMKAWAGLFMEMPPDQSGIFITDNEQVIDYLTEAESICSIGKTTGPFSEKWVKILADYVNTGNREDLDSAIVPDSGEKGGLLMDIHVAEGISPRNLFSGFIPNDIRTTDYPVQEETFRNSVVCYIHEK